MMTATNSTDAARCAATDEAGDTCPWPVAADSSLVKSNQRRHEPAGEPGMDEVPDADPEDEAMMWFSLEPADEATGPNDYDDSW